MVVSNRDPKNDKQVLGLMQHDRGLLISQILEHAAVAYPELEIISIDRDHCSARLTIGELRRRVAKAAHALQALGVGRGDVVATLAWNDHRHLTLYYAVSGIGAIIHTVNPRLGRTQIHHITDEGGSRLMFYDRDFTHIIGDLQQTSQTTRSYFAWDNYPEANEACGHSYDGLLDGHQAEIVWPEFEDGTAAGLCFTSGTTGDPKGVLYSHRSTILHALISSRHDAFDLRPSDRVLAVVPMFHVNAWGLPYSCLMSGASLVLPGPNLDGESLYRALKDEHCTISFGVPTVWMSLLSYLNNNPDIHPIEELQLRRIIIGGAAAPPSLIDELQKTLDIDVVLAWGMTELSPLGTVGVTPRQMPGQNEEQRSNALKKQGRAIFGIDLKIVDETGKKLPNDGNTQGRLLVRGPWVINRYLKSTDRVVDEEGYFETGDVATITPDGQMEITDRTKDVIKSGGEWISSIAIENAAIAHTAVEAAAVVGTWHKKWQERPLLVARLKPGASVDKEELLDHLSCLLPKWWLPDEILFWDSIPLTATGKIDKKAVRAEVQTLRSNDPIPVQAQS